MKANTENFKDIFYRQERFEVPFFQRRYVWTEDEWRRCIDDVRQVATGGPPHFMGSLIFKREPGNDFTNNLIIDGQQRITTLSILFYAVCRKYKQMEKLAQYFELAPEEHKFSHTRADRQVFNWIIYHDCDPAKAFKDIEEHQLHQCLTFFKDQLENDQFITPDVLEEKLYFVTISLDPEDDEQAIFETINSLGVELTTAELLKNDLFRHESWEFFNSTWGQTFESHFIKNYWQESMTCGKQESSNNINVFLRAYYDIAAEYTCEHKKFSSLFKSYQRHIANAVTDKHEFIQDLTQTATLYRRSFSRELLDLDHRTLSPVQRICLLVLAIQQITMLPYILYVLKNATPEEAAKIFRLLETYIIRRWICDLTNTRYNLQAKSLIVHKLTTYEALLEKLSESEDDTSKMPTQKEMWLALVSGNKKVTNNKLAKILLFFIENHLRMQNMQDRSQPAYSSCELEFLMPKKLDTWIAQKDLLSENTEYLKKIQTKLGNITLVSKKLPAGTANDIWTKKIENGLKENCSIFLTAESFLNQLAWNKDDINKRTCDLASLALEIWDYELDEKVSAISINRANVSKAREYLQLLEESQSPYEIVLLQKCIEPDLTDFKQEVEAALLRTIYNMDQQNIKTTAVSLEDSDSLKFYSLIEKDFSGTKPAIFKFFSDYYPCSNWKDFLLKSVDCFCKKYPEQMKRICASGEVSNLTSRIPTQYINLNRHEQITDFCAVRFHLPTTAMINIILNLAATLDLPGDAITVSLKTSEKSKMKGM
ncbi:MAG: DUF262 domain-containing protein [Lentisphaeria bacterium]|nr:DUF262 domain-containing protein [Lentisphaeria bacterium]